MSSPQGKFAQGAALLDGRRLLEASAWGKHLFVEFDGDAWLHVHLGLIGKFDVTTTGRLSGADRPGQVRLRLLSPAHVADLRGPNLCAVVTPEQVEAHHLASGPTLCGPDPDPDTAWHKISRSSRSIAELLMDQAVVAGIGNVYRCELLYRHRVDPFRPGREIRPVTWRAMWDDIVRPDAPGDRRRPDRDDARPGRGGPGRPGGGAARRAGERRYLVYRRAQEPCRVCGARVHTQVVAGRNLFWCGRCQRRR